MNKTGTAAGGHFYVKEPGSALTHFIRLLLAIAFLAPILVLVAVYQGLFG